MPAIAVLPLVSATVNLLLSQAIPPLALRVAVNVTASETVRVPSMVVALPLAPILTGPPPKVVKPVEVANILLAAVEVPLVISPPLNTGSAVKVVTPEKVGVPDNIPDKAAALIVGFVKVLFVNVVVLAAVTAVPPPVLVN